MLYFHSSLLHPDQSEPPLALCHWTPSLQPPCGPPQLKAPLATMLSLCDKPVTTFQILSSKLGVGGNGDGLLGAALTVKTQRTDSDPQSSWGSKIRAWSWREGSVLKSMYCSYRGWGLVPRIHKAAHKLPVITALGYSTFLWTSRTLTISCAHTHTRAYMHMYTHTCTWTHTIKNNEFWYVFKSMYTQYLGL